MEQENRGEERPRVDRASVFLALTIGFPFSAFKILFGVLAWRNGLSVPGIALLVWGAGDLGMNAARVVQSFRPGKSATEFCVLAQLGKRLGLAPVLLAVDTFLSFSIICVVLWSGWIAQLTLPETVAWLSATTVNLLSVALTQIWVEWKRHRVERAGVRA
ncbi:MAG: hypothetical protein ACYS47_03980 [Planctomycetota bacterium]|jgi:hypothetical protein